MTEEQSTLHKLIFNLNLVADMKVTFNIIYDEVTNLLESLTVEERESLGTLVRPEYVINDLESGLGEFWAESADSYEPIDLEGIN